jgi:NADP-dependent 3-hydroxy acid dehydrogenase YdfG
MNKLKGRTAVVTGAASGIGRAVALALADQGCNLALVDVHAERLAEVAALIPGASIHQIDVSNREAMMALPQAVLDAHGAVHVVVNNAGVSCSRLFSEHTLEDWDWIIGINLWGVVYGCHAFLPHLMAADWGHIVNISSIFGIIGMPSQASYAATKYAVRGLSEVLWEELAHTHVGVTVVHPGGVDTNIVRDGRNSQFVDQDRIQKHFTQHTLSPEMAARQIVRAIQRGDRRLRITREAVLFDWLKRLAPVAGNRVIAAILSRTLGLTEIQKKLAETYRAKG